MRPVFDGLRRSLDPLAAGLTAAGTAEAGADAMADRIRGRQLLLVIAWLGLATGLTEVALLAIARFGLHRYVHVGLGVTWMAPLADVLLLGAFAVVLVLLGLLWRPLGSGRLVVGALAFAAAFGVLLLARGLYAYARILLALGIGVQAGWWFDRYPEQIALFMRRTVGWLALIVIVLGTAATAWPRWQERRMALTLPTATVGAPNVLIVVLDAVRAASLSLYGYPRSTSPELTRFARGGVLFQDVIAPASWTLPSHATLFTGRWPHEHGADWTQSLAGTYPTLAEILARHGYATAGFVGNTWYCSRVSGLSRGFMHYEDYRVSLGEIVMQSSLGGWLASSTRLRGLIGYYELLGRNTAPEVSGEFIRWLDRHGQRPFFAFINFFDAHGPYLAPAPFTGRFGSRPPHSNAMALMRPHWTEAEARGERDSYDASIAYLDHQVGALLEQLERRGDLRNTLVVITADHGEEFYEHGTMEHGYSLYRPVLWVPLIFRLPGRVPAGRVVPQPVSLRDVPETVLDVLELDRDERFPGRSLVPLWTEPDRADIKPPETVLSEIRTGGSALLPRYPVAHGDMQSVIVGNLHYIHNGDGRVELYDTRTDPLEQHDLAGLPALRHTAAALQAALDSVLARR